MHANDQTSIAPTPIESLNGQGVFVAIEEDDACDLASPLLRPLLHLFEFSGHDPLVHQVTSGATSI